LILQNTISSNGSGPAFIHWSVDGSHAFVANYNSGSAAIFPVEKSSSGDSHLSPASDVDQHYGRGPLPNQDGPHAHQFISDPTGMYGFVCDLGNDRIYQYQLLPNGKLTNNTAAPWIVLDPGSGPRHLVFHPTNDFVYVVTEMGNTVLVFPYNKQTGSLSEVPIQTISTLPHDYVGTSSAAEVMISVNGNFLYASNRGYDSIVSYQINVNGPAEGHLQVLGWTTERITTPRAFTIVGNLLLVGSSTTNEIVPFSINEEDGSLKISNAINSVPAAYCIQVATVSD